MGFFQFKNICDKEEVCFKKKKKTWQIFPYLKDLNFLYHLKKDYYYSFVRNI